MDDEQADIVGGDVVTLRVEPLKDNTPLQFDKDGHVDSQQVVKLVFLKNGVVVSISLSTPFNLITTHTRISAQSGSFFSLWPVYFYPLLYESMLLVII